jgi:hypothetical protein
MTQTRARLVQDVARLGGHYAHVLDEPIDSRHDDATGETWLYDRFAYVLSRRWRPNDAAEMDVGLRFVRSLSTEFALRVYRTYLPSPV